MTANPDWCARMVNASPITQLQMARDVLTRSLATDSPDERRITELKLAALDRLEGTFK